MSFENNIKMFSEKESEELFDNLFTLEDNESSRVLDLNCDVASHQFNSNYDPNTKNLANINNKAFGSNLVNLNKLNGCLQMDLLSKNYDFNENGSDYGNEVIIF